MTLNELEDLRGRMDHYGPDDWEEIHRATYKILEHVIETEEMRLGIR